MHKKVVVVVTGLVLLTGGSAGAQIISGILYVNNTHMS